ncbi:M35 family metallo-endopeptidase [Hyalangium sp.]|uniref:M35 family metallo-endopeptidase n=1 Tax=Hyalangium sp. TaxID=2028555 RepID=UPI002D3C75B5|nr:M35 family metallo-endopeptidase [Hyalangium sp.]HYH94884.1 M35 family metallo-endopeptidase [Hyalangium sp.]
MNHLIQGRLWLIGSIVSVSLMGACAPEDEGALTESAQVLEAHAEEQELSAGTELRGLEVTLSADKASIGAKEEALVKVTLRNSGPSRSVGPAKAIKLLKWFTPAEGLEESLFVVTREGAQVAYEGPHFKRSAAQESDYLTLKPGESQTWTVDLAEAYDLSRTGSYTIRFAVGSLASNELQLRIEGRGSKQYKAQPEVTIQAVSFSKCDSTQQSTVLQALSAASNYANASVSYLNGTPSATPRYTTWFGAYSSSGWNTAKSHFIAIKDVYDTKTVTFDCSCRKKYYAYVYPNQPYKIYLCSVFWQAPMTGTDSKAGTIIHETSHFTVVAGTDDWAYGHSAAKSLAISDPTRALNNADSHEYFAENTPAQQ